jgi:hypothetical protein
VSQHYLLLCHWQTGHGSDVTGGNGKLPLNDSCLKSTGSFVAQLSWGLGVGITFTTKVYMQGVLKEMGTMDADEHVNQKQYQHIFVNISVLILLIQRKV